MEDKDSQFLEKLKAGNKIVSFYIGSELATSINVELMSKYMVDIDVIHSLVQDFFISDFNISQLKQNVKNILVTSGRYNEFICDFLGKLFLPIAGLINIDISKELKANGSNVENYKKNIDDFILLIENESRAEALEFIEDFENTFDIKEEENIVINFLGENILGILSDSDNTGCLQMNGSLVYLLINKKDSLNKFVNAFLGNNEKLSNKKIVLNGKEEDATISNIIKHFIAQNGSGMFSSIVLAKYLSSTEISNVFDEKGKKILRKILKIYRNLVFFPDSMTNIPIDEWEIFPLEDISSDAEKNDVTPVVEEKPVYHPVNTHEEEIKVLKELLQKYPNKSLEKKAIEGEIKKIQEK